MCDVNVDKLSAEEEMKRKTKVKDMSTCMKCKIEKPVVIVRVHDPMCRLCFLQYATHKFRSTLGKSKLVKANDKVLIAVSGGHSSIAMLHLVKEALSEGAHKRLKFSPGVVFIDESVTLNKPVDEQISSLIKEIEEYGYTNHLVPLHKDITKEDSDCDTEIKEFKEKLDRISTLTAKTDFVDLLKLQLIVHTAKTNNYTKIMIGENSTTLSMKLLCNISQGRGLSLPQDIAVGDDRFSDVMIIRPMREFSSKEVAMYNRLNGLKHHSIPNLHTMKEAGSSLQRQTEEFITGLQADFPSTVSTVFRTGDKLCSDSSININNQSCTFCQGPLSNIEEEKDVGEKACGKQGEGCCGTSEECSSNKFKISGKDIKSHLCYGCNLTFKDMDHDVNSLPSFVLDTISTDIKRSKMKESIQEFLLE